MKNVDVYMVEDSQEQNNVIQAASQKGDQYRWKEDGRKHAAVGVNVASRRRAP